MFLIEWKEIINYKEIFKNNTEDMASGLGESVSRPRARSINDAVPLKSRMYSAWYRFRYGELSKPDPFSRTVCQAVTRRSLTAQVGSFNRVFPWTMVPCGYWGSATMLKSELVSCVCNIMYCKVNQLSDNSVQLAPSAEKLVAWYKPVNARVWHV